MDIMEAMRQRHSVRRYENRPLDEEAARTLEELVAAVNKESGLHIQLVKDEPKAFDSAMARYGHFSGVTNYFALIGKKARHWRNSAATMAKSWCWRRSGWG